MLRVMSLSFCICVGILGIEYPLKSIGLALADSKPSIPAQSKQLLESTSGIQSYQAQISPLLKAKIHKRENLVIRVLGDSHIAGDFLSHRLRNLLFKNYSFGLLYPLYPLYHQHIALKYQSQNFEILNSRINEPTAYPLGGVIAKPTALPAYITLSPINPTNATTKIIFKAPDTKAALRIEDSAKAKFIINAKRASSWQILSMELQYPISIYALNEKVLLGGMYITQRNGGNNIVESLGINGARSDIWLKWDRELFMQQMRILPADLYILCYGSNDAMHDNFNESVFIKHYGELIDNIREANPNTTILLLSPPPVVQKTTKGKRVVYKKSKNANITAQAITKLAKEKQTLLFSMEDFINQSGGKAKWESANLAKPDVHLLPNGYKLIADKLYYELLRLK